MTFNKLILKSSKSRKILYELNQRTIQMKFSVWFQPLHHPTEHPTIQIERDLELIENLDKLGYDAVWIGEHHTTGWEPIGAPELLLAAAASRTRRIKLGGGIIPLAIHHPLHVLERSILLDHLSHGRAALGIGVGGGIPTDLTLYGLDRDTARNRFKDSIDTIVSLLYSDEPVSVKTEWFELHQAILQIKPYGKFPIVIPTTNPETLQLLGEIGGVAMIGGNFDKIDEYYSYMEKGAELTGRDISRAQILIVQNMYLGNSIEEIVSEIKKDVIREKTEFYEEVQGYQMNKDNEEWFNQFLEKSIIGSPEDAVAKIKALLDITGEIGGIIFRGKDWGSDEFQHRSFKMFARYVMPHFTKVSDGLLKAAKVAITMEVSE